MITENNEKIMHAIDQFEIAKVILKRKNIVAKLPFL